VGEEKVRAARGAIRVREDSSEEIFAATERLLTAMFERNGVESEDVVSVFFTATEDLRWAFAAEAARRMGLGEVPLMCAQEIPVRGAMPASSGSSCTSTRFASSGRSPHLPRRRGVVAR
jgi:chorismate mutase